MARLKKPDRYGEEGTQAGTDRLEAVSDWGGAQSMRRPQREGEEWSSSVRERERPTRGAQRAGTPIAPPNT